MLSAGSLVVLSMVLGATVGPSGAPTPRPAGSPAVSEPAAGTAQLEDTPITATPRKRWYGWELLLSDVAFLTLAAQEPHSTPLLWTAVVGLTLGTPALHFANGNRLMGAVSAGVRLSIVGITSALASRGSDCHDDVCKDTVRDIVLPASALIAGLLFMIVDDTALARVTEPARGASAGPMTSRRPPRRVFVPVVAPTTGGATMALVGTF